MPGSLLAIVIAVVASMAELQFGGAVMLYALLLGMLAHALSAKPAVAPGIAFCSRRVLRFGVALLGARLTLVDVSALGVPTVLLIVAGVTLTLTAGVAIGRWLGLQPGFAVLSAGAVAICGASAALAIAAVLPTHDQSERQTILTVVGVTALSTVAMVLYPLIAEWLSMDMHTAGIFLGASIHDVAQVVAAGAMVSPETRDTATLVKLMRVACLVPAVALIAWLFNRGEKDADGKPVPSLPFFLIAFVVLMLVNTLGLIPTYVQQTLTQTAAYCLVVAVAALGVKTSVSGMLALGARPIIAIVLQTTLLGVFVLSILLIT
ncbi:MAG: putative sulfate exporter family transporter [Pseudomonadota bacterium]